MTADQQVVFNLSKVAANVDTKIEQKGKGKGKARAQSFKNMQGKHDCYVVSLTELAWPYPGQSMKPTDPVAKVADDDTSNTLSGMVSRKSLRSLKGWSRSSSPLYVKPTTELYADVRLYKKSQVPRLAHGLETVLSRSVGRSKYYCFLTSPQPPFTDQGFIGSEILIRKNTSSTNIWRTFPKSRISHSSGLVGSPRVRKTMCVICVYVYLVLSLMQYHSV